MWLILLGFSRVPSPPPPLLCPLALDSRLSSGVFQTTLRYWRPVRYLINSCELCGRGSWSFGDGNPLQRCWHWVGWLPTSAYLPGPTSAAMPHEAMAVLVPLVLAVGALGRSHQSSAILPVLGKMLLCWQKSLNHAHLFCHTLPGERTPAHACPFLQFHPFRLRSNPFCSRLFLSLVRAGCRRCSECF